ncbi:hypothetical protein EJB05_52414, partial [Eragrostis curvula]
MKRSSSRRGRPGGRGAAAGGAPLPLRGTRRRSCCSSSSLRILNAICGSKERTWMMECFVQRAMDRDSHVHWAGDRSMP